MNSESTNRADIADEVKALLKKLLPILATADAAAQHACLGDLVAMYLATHESAALRKRLLKLHVEQVRHLLPIRLEELRQRQIAAARDHASGQVH